MQDGNQKTILSMELKIGEFVELFKQAPAIIGMEALKLFQENFERQGWQGTTFEP